MLSSAPAPAVTISYLEDLREIHAFSVGRFGTDHGDRTAQPSPAFADFSTGIRFQDGAAWQVSYLGEASMAARGFAMGSLDVLTGGDGTSLFHVVFSIDEATPWSLSGVLERAQVATGYNSALARVVLSSGGSEIFSQALPPNSICCPADYWDPLSVPVLASGELAAGEYELLIEAVAGEGPTETHGTSFFDLVFVLPEPGAGLLVLGALAVALTRRLRLRS